MSAAGASQCVGSNRGNLVAGRAVSSVSTHQDRDRRCRADSRKLARQLRRDNGWKLQIVKRKQRAFKVAGLTWIVERTFAWLGRNRRLSKDYEYSVQTSETMIDIAAIRLMLNRIVPT